MSNPIGWCDLTLNVGVAGCTRISPGCEHCWAERMTQRQVNMGNYPAEVVKDWRWTGKVVCDYDKIGPAFKSLPKKVGKRVAVQLMADLFHKDVPFDFIVAVWGAMASMPHHTFQVLTKRAERMAEFFAWLDADRPDSNGNPVSWYPFAIEAGKHGIGCNEPLRRAVAAHPSHIQRNMGGRYWPIPNIWCGVTVEDQQRADERIPHLLKVPAAVRFLSMEPMLGQVLLDNGESSWLTCNGQNRSGVDGEHVCCESFDATGQCFHGIDWVISGGESGPKARPMHPDWATSLRDQCQAAGVPFLHKQNGTWVLKSQKPAGVTIRHCRDFGVRRPDGTGATSTQTPARRTWSASPRRSLAACSTVAHGTSSPRFPVSDPKACLYCDAIMPGDTRVCPACGIEFTGTITSTTTIADIVGMARKSGEAHVNLAVVDEGEHFMVAVWLGLAKEPKWVGLVWADGRLMTNEERDALLAANTEVTDV